MQQRKKEIQSSKEAPRHAESMITVEQSDLVEKKWKRFETAVLNFVGALDVQSCNGCVSNQHHTSAFMHAALACAYELGCRSFSSQRSLLYFIACTHSFYHLHVCLYECRIVCVCVCVCLCVCNVMFHGLVMCVTVV